jgi:hypothetical protein
MRGIALCCLQRSSAYSKGFGVQLLRTYSFNIIKGDFKNNEQLVDHLIT